MTTLQLRNPATWPAVDDDPTPWQALARCAEADPDTWFADKSDDPDGQAKAICARCEVRGECLAYALEHDERHGIWGGLDEHERNLLRRRQARQTHKAA